ncbi:MAG TPA: hypothetical protein PKD61_22970, partial [Polyangiaceae bacterium]|nr:hypothetical protein [Polyangiaceae bacterium]
MRRKRACCNASVFPGAATPACCNAHVLQCPRAAMPTCCNANVLQCQRAAMNCNASGEGGGRRRTFA